MFAEPTITTEDFSATQLNTIKDYLRGLAATIAKQGLFKVASDTEPISVVYFSNNVFRLSPWCESCTSENYDELCLQCRWRCWCQEDSGVLCSYCRGDTRPSNSANFLYKRNFSHISWVGDNMHYLEVNLNSSIENIIRHCLASIGVVLTPVGATK